MTKIRHIFVIFGPDETHSCLFLALLWTCLSHKFWSFLTFLDYNQLFLEPVPRLINILNAIFLIIRILFTSIFDPFSGVYLWTNFVGLFLPFIGGPFSFHFHHFSSFNQEISGANFGKNVDNLVGHRLYCCPWGMVAYRWR